MLVWIFGGTAVGKKHFIRDSILNTPEFAGFVPSWMEDGPLEEEGFDLFIQDKQNRLVRWQWTREHALADLREKYPDITQKIILLTVPSAITFQRATKREGESPWTEAGLAAESQIVRWLAMGLAADYDISLTELDYS